MINRFSRGRGLRSHLFENEVLIIFAFQRCVGIIKLTEHDSLGCDQRTEQLNQYIRMYRIIQGLNIKCKLFDRMLKSIENKHTESMAISSCCTAMSWIFRRIPSFSLLKMTSPCWSNISKPSMVIGHPDCLPDIIYR